MIEVGQDDDTCTQHKQRTQTTQPYVVNGLSGLSGLDNHKNLAKSLSCLSSITWKKAFSMSVDKAGKNVGVFHIHQLKVCYLPEGNLSGLAWAGDWQLQLYTILTRVVKEFLYTGWCRVWTPIVDELVACSINVTRSWKTYLLGTLVDLMQSSISPRKKIISVKLHSNTA